MLAANEGSLGLPQRNHCKSPFLLFPPGQKEVTGFSSCSTSSLPPYVIDAKLNMRFLRTLYGGCTFHIIRHRIPQVPTRRYVTAAASFATQTVLSVHKLVRGRGECCLGRHRFL